MPLPPAAEILAEEVHDPGVLPVTRASGMGADKHVRQCPKGVVFRERLLGEHVEVGAAQGWTVPIMPSVSSVWGLASTTKSARGRRSSNLPGP
jgi:hypothetical protein